jgi:small basic protein
MMTLVVVLLVIGLILLGLYYAGTVPEPFVRFLGIAFLVAAAVALLFLVADVDLEDADAALAGMAAVCRWRMP